VKPEYVAVFDCDGTIIPKSWISLFSVVDHNCGFAPKILEKAQLLRKKYIEKAIAGTLTKEEERQWFYETIDYYVEGGLNQFAIRRSLEQVKVRTGVMECFRFLKRNNVPIAIISYGIEYFIHTVLAKNKISELVDAVYSAELVFNANGFVTGYKPETATFPDNKGIFSCRFANFFNVDFENILAVGDSGGDANLGHLKSNRLGIAKDQAEEGKIRQFMGEVLITEDFKPVQKWLEKKIRAAH